MILRRGITNNRVSELQTLLKRNGFWSHPSITNFFGPVTELAVIAFQRANKLKDDGVVGPKTWSILTTPIENKITPVYNDEDVSEDFSDPEEEMIVGDIKESQPTCPNISELIKLINDSNITRKVTRLVFHCTATQQTATVEAIVRHWRQSRGWTNPGYHILVRADGSWTQLQDFNKITNGVAGINTTSLHVSYIGGIGPNGRALDNRTDKQKEVFETVYNTFKNKMPNLTFHGHYEFSNKACPSFNVEKWIEEINLNV